MLVTIAWPLIVSHCPRNPPSRNRQCMSLTNHGRSLAWSDGRQQLGCANGTNIVVGGNQLRYLGSVQPGPSLRAAKCGKERVPAAGIRAILSTHAACAARLAIYGIPYAHAAAICIKLLPPANADCASPRKRHHGSNASDAPSLPKTHADFLPFHAIQGKPPWPVINSINLAIYQDTADLGRTTWYIT